MRNIYLIDDFWARVNYIITGGHIGQLFFSAKTSLTNRLQMAVRVAA